MAKKNKKKYVLSDQLQDIFALKVRVRDLRVTSSRLEMMSFPLRIGP